MLILVAVRNDHFMFCSDKYGRKVVIMLSIVASSLGSLAGAFMPEYWSFLVTRSAHFFILRGWQVYSTSCRESLFRLHAHICTLWLRPRHPPPPPHLGSYTRALLVSKDRRHLFVRGVTKSQHTLPFQKPSADFSQTISDNLVTSSERRVFVFSSMLL